jgi:hypothetical protein
MIEMKCPRCKLINPETALRCDCGYDFETKTVEQPYFTQPLPKDIRSWLIFVIVYNIIGAALSVASGDVIRFVAIAFWIVIIYWCYANLVKKKNWARITLVVITFPVGLILLKSEARLYCLQSKA